MGEGELRIIAAEQIGPDSWLNDERFMDFARAYGYASTQTTAIDALSKCSPEEMYHAYEALRRGHELYAESASTPAPKDG